MPTKFCPHCGKRTGFEVKFNIFCRLGDEEERGYLRTCQECGGRFITIQADECLKGIMEFKLSTEDKERIEEGIRKKYAEASVTPQGLFNYPTGREGLEGLGYDPKMVASIPGPVIDSFCGVGNPFSLGEIHAGETVLDIGCGGGVDVICAAMMVGSKGSVTGIDVTLEMLERSKKNLRQTPVENVTLRQTTAEELPFPDNHFDVIISNGVFNLICEKAKAFSEVFRVLKLGGRLMVADQILIGELSYEQRLSAESWAQ